MVVLSCPEGGTMVGIEGDEGGTVGDLVWTSVLNAGAVVGTSV